MPISGVENEKKEAEMSNKPTVYTNARYKMYPHSVVKEVATGACFPLVPGAPRPRPFAVSPPGQAKDKERSLESSRQRARARVRDMALCNPFEYFFTWTIAPDLLDRYDPKAIYPKLRNFLSNAVRRKGLSYLIVPEYHEQKPGEDKPAIHFHGLCALGKVEIKRAKDKRGHRMTDRNGRPVFHMTDWKYGFSTRVPLDENRERTANYIVKYITKNGGAEKIFGKWYLHSRDLVKGPEIIPLDPERYNEFRDEAKLRFTAASGCSRRNFPFCKGGFSHD